VLTNHAPADEKRLCKTKRDERKINDAAALGTNARSAGGALSRLLKNAPKCHPEVAPVFGERRICFTSNARKQQILRFHPSNGKSAVAGDPGCAQDDTLEGEFFSSPLARSS
jgi:hypothetical protein